MSEIVCIHSASTKEFDLSLLRGIFAKIGCSAGLLLKENGQPVLIHQERRLDGALLLETQFL